MTRFAIALSLFLAAVPSFAARRRTTTAPPPFPPCSSVEGTPGVAISRDQGATLIRPTQRLEGIGYSYGLAQLGATELLSTHKQTLYRSLDAGCSWTAVGTLEGEQFYRIATGANGRNYIWDDNREYLVRYETTTNTITKLKPPGAIIGLGVDPAAGHHLLIGTNEGVVWESNDAGETWSRRGELPRLPAPIFYRFTFYQSDINRVVAGVANSGAYYSGDGGRTWFQSTVEPFPPAPTNIFNLVFSDDGTTVWAMGVNLKESDANVPSHGRHIYLSQDGGAVFRPVIDESPTVQFVNQPVMAVNPQDPNVFYFIFGTYFQGYGTDIYRYDHNTRTLTTFHNEYDDINAIVFSTKDSNVMYFGLETEKRNAP